MHEGCRAAVMGSSVHSNNGLFGAGGYINDSYYRQQHYNHEENFQQLHYLDQQMLGHKMFYPVSPISPLNAPQPSSATTACEIQQTIPDKEIENNYMKRELNSSSSLEAIAAAVAVAPHEVLDGRGDAQLLGVASPQILDYRSSVADAFHETGELGSIVLGARRHLSWGAVHEEQQQQRGFHSQTRIIHEELQQQQRGLLSQTRVVDEEQQQRGFHSRTSDDIGLTIPPRPFTPIHDILSPPASPLASPAMPPSPDCKVPEPRSVLDLATSPRPSTRHSAAAIHPSYEFGISSLGGGIGEGNAPNPSILNAADDEFLAEFQARDSSSTAQLLGLDEDDEDSSQWDPPAKSTIDWLQETSQLWMDSLMDDLADTTPVHSSSLPRLDEEDDLGDEARADTPSTSTPCPSELCHTSPSFDQDHSEDQGDDDEDEEDEEEEEITRRKVREGGGIATDICTAAAAAEKDLSTATLQPPRETKRKGVPSREAELKLVSLLLSCAEALSTKSLSLINPLFAELGDLASPEGTSMQRVAAYFTEGLATRCTRLWPQIYQPLPHNLELSEEECLSAFHILNHVSPYIKFAHFTANDIILQAFEGCDRVHVIDFDIKQGLQWPALFQSLAARPGGPPSHIRVTGVGEYKEDVQDTGDRLAEFAEALDLPFEFHSVIDKLEDVRLWMLHVKEKETVAVNCVLQLHRALLDSENGIKDMLRLITSTKPKVVAVVEQEASHNGHFLEGRCPRFLEALQYYAALFDSLDSNMPPESKARMKVEQFFAREIRNIVACEGPERVERHEGIKTWRLHMDRGGFKSVPVSLRAKTQAELLLEMYGGQSYTISEDEDALILGWQTRFLFTASGWAPTLL